MKARAEYIGGWPFAGIRHQSARGDAVVLSRAEIIAMRRAVAGRYWLVAYVAASVAGGHFGDGRIAFGRWRRGGAIGIMKSRRWPRNKPKRRGGVGVRNVTSTRP